MKNSSFFAFTIFAGLTVGTAAHAQSAGNLLGAPLVAAGNAVNGVAAGHAGIAPVVNQTVPTAEYATDGVTNAIAAVGTGVTATGVRTQQEGLQVGSPSGGSGKPLASVGATSPAHQGTVAALLNGRR